MFYLVSIALILFCLNRHSRTSLYSSLTFLLKEASELNCETLNNCCTSFVSLFQFCSISKVFGNSFKLRAMCLVWRENFLRSSKPGAQKREQFGSDKDIELQAGKQSSFQIPRANSNMYYLSRLCMRKAPWCCSRDAIEDTEMGNKTRWEWEQLCPQILCFFPC